MDTMQAIAGTDIYLLDQLMKKNIHPRQRILDAGCGMGRNITWLLNRGAEVWGIDISEDDIKYLQKTFPHAKDHFIQSTIESFSAPVKFDVVICSAMLHFARSHDHFEDMFGQLVSFLNPGGILFIRMASNIGMERQFEQVKTGIYDLGDGTQRYLLTREKLAALVEKYRLKFPEPVKTTNVEDKRGMTTMVVRQ